eukprot:Em0058g9a
MPLFVYIRVDDYDITPLVTHVNTDRCQKKKNGILMFNRLWFLEWEGAKGVSISQHGHLTPLQLDAPYMAVPVAYA